MDQTEEREVVGRGLKAMLDIAAKNAKGLPIFAKQKAEELGVEFLGGLDERPDGATMLQFYHPVERLYEEHGKDWEKALDSLGQLVGFFAVPRELLFGIRGEHGDVLLKMSDIARYKHLQVFERLGLG